MSDSKYICSDDGTTCVNKDFISSIFIVDTFNFYDVVVTTYHDERNCMHHSRDKESAINYYKYLCELLDVGFDLSVDI